MEFGISLHIAHIKTGHCACQFKSGLYTCGRTEVGQVDGNGLRTDHRKGQVQCRACLRKQWGMELLKVCFGGCPFNKVPGFHIIFEWLEISIFHHAAIRRIHQFGLVGKAVKAYEHAFLQFKQGGGGSVVRTDGEVQFIGSCRQSDSFRAVGEAFAVGVSACLVRRSEHVNIQSGDCVLFFGGNGGICFGFRFSCGYGKFVLERKKHFTFVCTVCSVCRGTVCLVRFCRTGGKQHRGKQIHTCRECLYRSEKGT